MQYDFDTIVDRSETNATKLYGYKQYIFQDKDIDLGFDDEDFIHFWAIQIIMMIDFMMP